MMRLRLRGWMGEERGWAFRGLGVGRGVHYLPRYIEVSICLLGFHFGYICCTYAPAFSCSIMILLIRI